MAQCSLVIITLVLPPSDNPFPFLYGCGWILHRVTCLTSQRHTAWHSLVILKWRRKLFSQTPENTWDISTLFGMSQESSFPKEWGGWKGAGCGRELRNLCLHHLALGKKRGNFPQFIKCNPIFLSAIPPSHLPASVSTGSLCPSTSLILLCSKSWHLLGPLLLKLIHLWQIKSVFHASGQTTQKWKLWSKCETLVTSSGQTHWEGRKVCQKL